jgi:HSP90 family molecular chaperone
MVRIVLFFRNRVFLMPCATVIISDRLVISPCAVVADAGGYTANVQRIMSATTRGQDNSAMFEFAKRQKVLELNPRSPLIEGLLRRVEQLPGEEEERDLEAEDELREVAAVLIDGALVRSGFEVPDSDEYVSETYAHPRIVLTAIPDSSSVWTASSAAHLVSRRPHRLTPP